MAPTPAARLALALSEYTQTVHGFSPARVRIEFSFGDDGAVDLVVPGHLFRCPITVPFAVPSLSHETDGTVRDSEGQLSEREIFVLEIINRFSDDEVVRGEVIADRAGLKFCGSFRELLSKLASGGHILSSRRGYSRLPTENDDD